MKELDFKPHKSKEEFRNNYKLHDLAEQLGKNLLIQWGIRFDIFGKDRRYERVWEKGKDKPDLIISYKGKDEVLDWKNKINMPVFVAFFLFDEKENLIENRLAVVGVHKPKASSTKEWDKNKTVEFDNSLPIFTKSELLKYLLS